MSHGNGNALRASAFPENVVERSPHRGGSLNIANFPDEIRDELTWRMNDGEPCDELVEWLNAKPEVIKVMCERFDGRPISGQTSSELL